MEKYAGMNEGEVRLYKLLETLQDEAHKVHANLVIERHKEGTNQIDAIMGVSSVPNTLLLHSWRIKR